MRLLSWTLVLLLSASCARNIAPVDVTVSRDEAQLARGRYLALSVMACGACHARRDWTRPTGPPREGTELAGSGDIAREEGFPDSFSFSAGNLTPHGLGSWTDGEVARAIVFGQNKDRRGLFPYMPYFEYREALARDDLAALVAFLRSLEPVAYEPPGPPRFPMPSFVLNRFPEERTLREHAPITDPGDRGKYLAELGGCRVCHTQVDKRGTPVGTPYAGGREFRVPAPGAGTVRSANLTPDAETGLGAWSKELFVARFRGAGLEQARAQQVPDGGYNSVMPWWVYARMSDEDLGLLYDSLRSLPPTKGLVVKYSPP